LGAAVRSGVRYVAHRSHIGQTLNRGDLSVPEDQISGTISCAADGVYKLQTKEMEMFEFWTRVAEIYCPANLFLSLDPRISHVSKPEISMP
jgi:hypothetical protein